MLLPQNERERFGAYRNIISRCEISRGDRQASNRRLRTFYLTGSDTGVVVRYNKLREHNKASSGYIYSPSSVRFYCSLPPHYGEAWAEELDSAREELHRIWHDTPAALTAAQCVEWAGVYPTVIAKVFLEDNQPVMEMIPDPADIGVLREDLDSWDQQEAICHWYTMDLASFWRAFVYPLPREKDREALWAEAQEHAGAKEESATNMLPPTVERIVLAQASPNMIGAATGAPDPVATPHVRERVVQLAELWVRDDRIKDYRVVTNLLPTERILWDPPNSLLPGRHPFHALTLDPVPGYLWGVSPMVPLLRLQDWHEKKIEELDRREAKQLDPPIFIEGMSTAQTDEAAKRLKEPGGIASSPMPGAKATPLSPQPLPDPFGMLNEISRMFAAQGGLPQGLRGQTEQGVRSGEQAVAQASMGGTPIEGKAAVVESWAAGVATDMIRLRRQTMRETLKKEDGSEYLLAQVPGDLVARVFARSASPILRAQLKADADKLKQAGAIDNETLLEFYNAPMEDLLRMKARQMAKAASEQKERLLRAKEEQAAKRAGK